VAGDFSPLTIDSGHAGGRFAPPALLVATAIGLGTMDMPVPSVVEWEWLNWKFPRPVKAGETIYARWTLTQKRPPVGGAPTAIVVWRVDVHTADGALCAEGEVGASVRRKAQAARSEAAEPAGASGQAPRRRRGRRSPAPVKAPEAGPPPPPVEAAPKAAPADKSGATRRRRRRRSRAGASSNGPAPATGAVTEPPAPPPSQPPPPVAVTASAPPAGALRRVMKRLRRT
jgi:hypothetical protein